MIFGKDYIAAAIRMAEHGQAMGGKPGAALLRLAGVYFDYAADGLQAANDDTMAMGEGHAASPSGKFNLAN